MTDVVVIKPGTQVEFGEHFGFSGFVESVSLNHTGGVTYEVVYQVKDELKRTYLPFGFGLLRAVDHNKSIHRIGFVQGVN